MSLTKITPEQARKLKEDREMAYKLYNTVGQIIAVDAWFMATDEVEPPTIRLVKLRNEDGLIITAKPTQYISNKYHIGSTVFFMYLCNLQYELDNGRIMNTRKRIIFKPDKAKWLILD